MIALVAISLIAFVPGADEQPLRWKFAKGDVFFLKTESSSINTTSANGRGLTKEKEQKSWYKYTVVLVDEKVIVIDRVTERSETNGKPTVIPGGGNWDGVVVTFTLDKNYKVQKVDGIEKGILKVAGDNDELRKFMTATVSAEVLAMGVETHFRGLPTKPVKIGDEWSRVFTQPVPGMGSLQFDAIYKYSHSEKGIETISFKGSVKLLPGKADPDAPISIKKAEFTADEYAGDYIFDSKTGRLQSHSLTSKVTGKMTFSSKDKEFEATSIETSKTKFLYTDKSLLKD